MDYRLKVKKRQQPHLRSIGVYNKRAENWEEPPFTEKICCNAA